MERRLVFLALALLVGCSSGGDTGRPKTYPSTGKVTMGGKPVEGATVNFLPMEGSGTSAIGVTDADGVYSLSTFTSNDGALPGQYKVSIVKYKEGELPKEASGPPAGEIASGDIDVLTYAPPSETATAATSSAGGGPKSLLPARYASAETSGLRAMVAESGPNENHFDLK